MGPCPCHSQRRSTMPTKRERLETLVHDLKAFEQSKAGSPWTAAEKQKLDGMAGEIHILIDAIKAEKAADPYAGGTFAGRSVSSLGGGFYMQAPNRAGGGDGYASKGSG